MHDEICFVAGVDLAHVGRQFGDREPITDDFLKWVESEDRALVIAWRNSTRRAFFRRSRKIKTNDGSAAFRRSTR